MWSGVGSWYDMVRHDTGSASRRRFLRGLAGAGGVGVVASLAGCSAGDGGGGTYDLTLRSGISGGSVFSIASALQAELDERTDVVSMSNQESPGFPANNRAFAAGEADAIVTDNVHFDWSFSDEGPFSEDPIDVYPNQAFRMVNYYCYFVVPADSDVETIDDLPGHTVWPMPPAFGLRPPFEETLKAIGMWDDLDLIEVGPGDAPGAIAEGRMDVIGIYAANQAALPGWATEVDSRFDVRYVEPTDEWIQAAQDHGGLGYIEVPTFGWQQDIGTDTLHAVVNQAQMLFDPEVPDEVVSEIMRISHEHTDSLKQRDSGYPPHDDLSAMTDAFLPQHFDEAPIHTGAAGFYEEEGVWDDSWVSA